MTKNIDFDISRVIQSCAIIKKANFIDHYKCLRERLECCVRLCQPHYEATSINTTKTTHSLISNLLRLTTEIFPVEDSSRRDQTADWTLERGSKDFGSHNTDTLRHRAMGKASAEVDNI